MTDQKYKLAAPGPEHDLRAAVVALRQHLALFCGPDDAIANALFAKADAAIAAAPEPVCRWEHFSGHGYYPSCLDPSSHQSAVRQKHPDDSFCPHCGRKAEVVEDE